MQKRMEEREKKRGRRIIETTRYVCVHTFWGRLYDSVQGVKVYDIISENICRDFAFLRMVAAPLLHSVAYQK